MVSMLAERGDDVESRAFFSQYFSFDADQFFFLLLPEAFDERGKRESGVVLRATLILTG